jgi:hypothetical protein
MKEIKERPNPEQWSLICLFLPNFLSYKTLLRSFFCTTMSSHSTTSVSSYAAATNSPLSSWGSLEDVTPPPSPSTAFLNAPASSPTWGLLDLAPLAPWVAPIEIWVNRTTTVTADADPRQEWLEEENRRVQLRTLLTDNSTSVPWVEQGPQDVEARWEHCFRCRSISHKVKDCPRNKYPKSKCCGSRMHRVSRCP